MNHILVQVIHIRHGHCRCRFVVYSWSCSCLTTTIFSNVSSAMPVSQTAHSTSLPGLIAKILSGSQNMLYHSSLSSSALSPITPRLPPPPRGSPLTPTPLYGRWSHRSRAAAWGGGMGSTGAGGERRVQKGLRVRGEAGRDPGVKAADKRVVRRGW